MFGGAGYFWIQNGMSMSTKKNLDTDKLKAEKSKPVFVQEGSISSDIKQVFGYDQYT
jgi:hypothetical protein